MIQSYPHSPGYKVGGTSKEAAEAIRSESEELKARIVEALHTRGPMTPDEAAKFLGENKYNVRSRFTDLRTAGMIVRAGYRRKNESGMSANVMCLPSQQGDLL